MKMENDGDLLKAATAIMQRYIEKWYAKEITCPNDVAGLYLPIFAVVNEHKTRLVWDAAAEFDGTALNSMLIAGPDLNEPLLFFYGFVNGRVPYALTFQRCSTR